MANRLENMLKLQTDYQIPIRMDLNNEQLCSYYESHRSVMNDREKEVLLKEVIKDLQ